MVQLLWFDRPWVLLIFVLTRICFIIAQEQKLPDGIVEKLNFKTECLATNEDLTTFHCLPGEPLRIPCIDAEVVQCPQWAKIGECNKNPQYMLIHCRKSCETCIELNHGGVLQIAPVEETRRQVLQRLVETQEYQHWQAERSVDLLKTCVNGHELCTHWSLSGECEANAPYMDRECPAACRTC